MTMKFFIGIAGVPCKSSIIHIRRRPSFHSLEALGGTKHQSVGRRQVGHPDREVAALYYVSRGQI